MTILETMQSAIDGAYQARALTEDEWLRACVELDRASGDAVAEYDSAAAVERAQSEVGALAALMQLLALPVVFVADDTELATLHGIISLVEWLRCPAHTLPRGKRCYCDACLSQITRDRDAADAARLGGLPALVAAAEAHLVSAEAARDAASDWDPEPGWVGLSDREHAQRHVDSARRDVDRLRERLAVATRIAATRDAHGDLCMCVECCGTRRAA